MNAEFGHPDRYFKSKSLLIFLSLFIFGFLLYFSSLDFSFQFDDTLIKVNPYIRSWHQVCELFQFHPAHFVPNLTFLINYKIGGLETFGFHLFNTLFHIITSFFVYNLTLSLLKASGEKTKSAHLIAFFSSLLFLVHPIQTQSVIYITQRKTLLATLFYVLSVFLYIRGRSEKKVVLLFYSFSAAIFAMFCKEISITLPIILFICELFFFNRKPSLKKFSPFLFLLLVVPLLRFFQYQNLRFESDETFISETTLIPHSHYFFTQINVIRTYLRLLFLPIHQNLDYDYPISTTLLEWQTLGSLILIVGILFLAYRFFTISRLISFSIVWFFITLSLESSFFPISDVIFEHRLYLPMVGFSIFLSRLLSFPKFRNDTRRYVVISIVIVSVLSIFTFNRIPVWKNELTLWQDVVRKSPDKPRALHNLAVAHAKNKDLEEAISLLKVAIEKQNKTDKRLALHLFALAECYIQATNADAAIPLLEKITASYVQNPGLAAKAWIRLGDAYMVKNDLKRAYECYMKEKITNWNQPAIHESLYRYYRVVGNEEEAERRLQRLKQFYNF